MISKQAFNKGHLLESALFVNLKQPQAKCQIGEKYIYRPVTLRIVSGY